MNKLQFWFTGAWDEWVIIRERNKGEFATIPSLEGGVVGEMQKNWKNKIFW